MNKTTANYKDKTMMLLTKADRKRLPKLYEQDGDPKAKAYVKFFNPCGAGTWYATEFDGEDTFFGWVDLGFGPGHSELGYFSLKELVSFKGPLGIGIERDRHFSPTLLSEITAP